jgi:hypothetical protein
VAKGAQVSPTQATVTSSLAVSGEPLSNHSRVAVYSGGTWKAGVASFCGRVAGGNGGTISPVPAASRRAG